MRPSRDNTADAVVSMSRSSNDEAMPDWVAGCWVAGDGLLELGCWRWVAGDGIEPRLPWCGGV